MPAVSTAGRGPGVYPSCSRAVCRVRPNTNDANGYYEFLGLFPWASAAEIRAAARAGFKRWHPDGTQPDEARFIRLKEIAATLLDPRAKSAYDSVPNDGLWVDSETRHALAGAPGEQLEAALEPIEVEPPEPAGPPAWDWFSDGHRPGDAELAEAWYGHLVAAAPLAGYTRAIRVMLTAGDAPRWRPLGGILEIPRAWRPGHAAACALFAVLVAAKPRIGQRV